MTAKTLPNTMLSDTGFLDLDPLRLEYRMIGPPRRRADHRDAARGSWLRRPVGKFSGRRR